MSEATRTIQQQITVSWDFPVVFTHHVFEAGNPVLVKAIDRLGEHRRHRAMVFVDAQVLEANPNLATEVPAYFAAHEKELELATELQIVPGGEAAKNDLPLLEKLIRQLLEQRMDRQSFVVIAGGGAVLDAVGLAAALVHRGLRQVRLPTTVLGQNDAGVGVKNGVNFLGGKNAIGTFAPPFAVINDYEFLRTLSDRDWLCGVAEAFKVGIIRDREFFAWLVENADAFRSRDFAAMQWLVYRCAEIHLEHIRTNGDPFEYGRARPLDFGHWSAHKLELMSGFRISHGEAVAGGVLIDSMYAREQGWISAAELEQIRAGLARSGFALWFEELDQQDASGQRAVFAGLREFREHLGGELTVTFPRGIGARHEVHDIDLAIMDKAIDEVRHSFRFSKEGS
ncbi:MAG: 3-dehydroquinate synthase [Verrucomicrobiota bacterium]|nr:3-dehydroquinate synthase [Verrucomicrobiota bacterium]